MKKKGSALLLTIITMALLIVISVCVVSATTSTSVTNNKFDESYNLKLTAESGIVKAYTDLKVTANYSEFPLTGDKIIVKFAGESDNLSFTTNDGKYFCDVKIYNYDKRDSDITTKYKKYTIQAVATSKVNSKHSKTLTAYVNKVENDKYSTETFLDDFTKYAVSLIPKNQKSSNAVAVDAEGAEKFEHFYVPDKKVGPNYEKMAYIQGKIEGKLNTDLTADDLTLTGTKVMPNIKENASVVEDKWAKLDGTSSVYVYKTNSVSGTVTLKDIYDRTLTSNIGVTNKDAFFAGNSKKVILVSGDLDMNQGKFDPLNSDYSNVLRMKPGAGGGVSYGTTIKLAEINNCIILCTGNLFLKRSGVSFTNSSVCAYDFIAKNKQFTKFNENFKYSSVIEQNKIKEFITSNIEYKSETGVSDKELTIEPEKTIVYEE